MDAHQHLIDTIRRQATPLPADIADCGPLFDMIGKARFVLIGEATHGTEEFYRRRADLTRRLIAEYGFAAVAVEGDWPDCYRANRYVRGDVKIDNGYSALSGFQRFPAWMWRNEVVLEFLDWLRDHNDDRALPQEKAGFYGLDLYSLNASIAAVIDYLDKIDPAAARQAREHYGCFDHFYAENPQKYGYANLIGITPSCEYDVIQQLIALRRRAHDYMRQDGFVAAEAFFCAEQNAKLVRNAEEYYRTMFSSRASSWNLRDRHMMDSLNALAMHLSTQRGEPARIVVWAHNSHIGDARATEMSDRGEWNLGQLAREQYGDFDVRLIGFSTYEGTVTAASSWDGAAERKQVRPAMPESHAALLHETGLRDFLLILRDNDVLKDHLALSRLQRAIGVLYLPQSERQSHYFFCRLPEQYDAIIHIDRSSALTPLETTALWHRGEPFETYPFGF